MDVKTIQDTIDMITIELSKATDSRTIEVICYIETKNHLYSGYYSLFSENTIVLKHGHLLDDKECPRELSEINISIEDNQIVAFSYNVVKSNVL